MNFYEHHLGDYAEATAHLTFVEDAAYSRLIRKCYSTERPIPADLKAAQRLVGARTKEEQVAVQAVLEEFFKLEADGWHNDRCDEELARYRDKQPAATARREAVKERQHRARERRKAMFDELRTLGIVKPFDTSTAELESILSRHPSRTGHAPVTRDSTVTSRNGHAPVTASQSPVPNINPKRPVDNGDNSAQRARLPMEGAGAAKPKGLERADLKELLAELQPGRERSDG